MGLFLPQLCMFITSKKMLENSIPLEQIFFNTSSKVSQRNKCISILVLLVFNFKNASQLYEHPIPLFLRSIYPYFADHLPLFQHPFYLYLVPILSFLRRPFLPLFQSTFYFYSCNPSTSHFSGALAIFISTPVLPLFWRPFYL